MRPNAPTINKVEPPNWWTAFPQSPMLLLTGENLAGAKITTSYPGVQAERVDARPDGRHIFVWLKISTYARPGRVPLSVRVPAGSTTVNFPLLARSAAGGKFQGLTEGDVIYLVMPDRFADGDPTNNEPAQSPGTYDRSLPRAYHGGDLRGIREHLPYLRNLGVTALWLTPVYDNDNTSPQDYHGYGAVDFYAVDEHLGTLSDLVDLVAAAHRHGIRVFLDTVLNHTGPWHPWVKAPPQPDWFHGTADQHVAARASMDHLADPHAPPKLWRDLVEGWFADKLPDLNQENPRVAQYLLQNALWWAEGTGVDGYRLDTFPYVRRSFWSNWHRGLFGAYPHFSTIGEVFNSDPTVTAFFTGGRRQFDGIDSGVTTVFDFPFFCALRDVILRDAPASRLVGVLQRDWLYARPDLLVTFLGNHDVRRFVSEPGASKDKLKLAFSVLLTARGIPQLYYGDEIGMQGGEDPDNRRDFPGGFPGDPRNAFTAEGRTSDEQEIFSHVETLLRFRREHPALRGGRHWHLAWDDTFYAFVRETREERLLVIFNNATQPRDVRLNLQDTPLSDTQSLEPVFATATALVRDHQAELRVAPRSVAIYEVK
ncbi:MAG TPA: alpha-amylase family glycosyl hydrolase [Candidatus Acidoferrales bacterium]|nr:alpha-amylase family glycosyl hydrolase [Candidatus Acidoferrales bacterium]